MNKKNKKLLFLLLMFGITFSTTPINAFNALHSKYLPYIAATGAVVGGFFGFTNDAKDGALYKTLQKYSGYNWLCDKMSRKPRYHNETPLQHQLKWETRNRIFSAFVSALLGCGAGYGLGWLFTPAAYKYWATWVAGGALANQVAVEEAENAEQVVDELSGIHSKFPYTKASDRLKIDHNNLCKAYNYLTKAVGVESENAIDGECRDLLNQTNQAIYNIGRAQKLVKGSEQYKEEQPLVIEERRVQAEEEQARAAHERAWAENNKAWAMHRRADAEFVKSGRSTW